MSTLIREGRTRPSFASRGAIAFKGDLDALGEWGSWSGDKSEYLQLARRTNRPLGVGTKVQPAHVRIDVVAIRLILIIVYYHTGLADAGTYRIIAPGLNP